MQWYPRLEPKVSGLVHVDEISGDLLLGVAMGAADAATARATIVTAKRMMNDLGLSGLK
jgi:hypothetical protein